MTCLNGVEESGEGEKFIGGYKIMWITKLKVIITKILVMNII